MSSIQEELGIILAKAKPMELGALAEILKAESLRPDHIVEAFWWNCQSVFGYVGGSEPSYSQIVCQVAEKLGIEHFGVKVEDLEVEIARKVFQTVWEKMTPDQKMAMEAELRRAAQEFDKGGGTGRKHEHLYCLDSGSTIRVWRLFARFYSTGHLNRRYI